MDSNIPKVRLDACLEEFGSARKLAAFLGISTESIYNWKRESKIYLPDVRAFQVAVKFPDLVEQPEKATA